MHVTGNIIEHVIKEVPSILIVIIGIVWVFFIVKNLTDTGDIEEMPVATVTRTNDRFELKSLPDAYVVIRRMTYGEKLNRQDDMLNVSTNNENNSKSQEVRFQMMTRKIALQDFANLIIEHNLTDENDRPLNFKNPMDVLNLDPVVGDEIGQLIDSINSFEEKPEVKN